MSDIVNQRELFINPRMFDKTNFQGLHLVSVLLKNVLQSGGFFFGLVCISFFFNLSRNFLALLENTRPHFEVWL